MRNISIEAISLDNLSIVTGGCGGCCHHHHCGGGGGNTTIINNNGTTAAPAAAAAPSLDVQVASGGASTQQVQVAA